MYNKLFYENVQQINVVCTTKQNVLYNKIFYGNFQQIRVVCTTTHNVLYNKIFYGNLKKKIQYSKTNYETKYVWKVAAENKIC